MGRRTKVGSRVDYPIAVRPVRERGCTRPPDLRCRSAARAIPGARWRNSDTRVLRVLAVTRSGRALSVVHDNAERPVQDRGTPASAMLRVCARPLIVVER
jgi:hypothetical protein